jgi:hypothetical protein
MAEMAELTEVRGFHFGHFGQSCLFLKGGRREEICGEGIPEVSGERNLSISGGALLRRPTISPCLGESVEWMWLAPAD